MGYLIGFLGLGSIVVGIMGFSLGNSVIETTSGAMLLACIILCIFDGLTAIIRGVVGRDQNFNWLSLSRYARKPKSQLRNIKF